MSLCVTVVPERGCPQCPASICEIWQCWDGPPAWGSQTSPSFCPTYKTHKINFWHRHINTNLWNTEKIWHVPILTSTVLKTFLSWKRTSFHTTSTPSSVSMAREALSTPGTFPWLTCRGRQTNTERNALFLKSEHTIIF